MSKYLLSRTCTHICPRLNKLQNEQSNEDLLNEIAELKEECKKFRDELEKTKSENEIGNKYIKLLENKINLNQGNLKDDEENINYESKYHSMLDKSFEVLNSVSNKCDDEKGKLKGNVLYYAQKEPDYDSLIDGWIIYQKDIVIIPKIIIIIICIIIQPFLIPMKDLETLITIIPIIMKIILIT